MNSNNPSEGLQWSAGSYNPEELEQWKQKIYGAQYYDGRTAAESPVVNQPINMQCPEEEIMFDDDNDDAEQEQASDENEATTSMSMKAGRFTTSGRVSRHPTKNHGSTSTNNSSNKKTSTKKWKNDSYFQNNIAAISSNWEKEDKHYNCCYNIPLPRVLQQCVNKYFRKQKHLVWIVALAVVCTAVATLAMFRMAQTDSFTNNNISNNNSPTVKETEVRAEKPSLFDTDKNLNLLEPSNNNESSSGSSSSSSLFETSKTANLFEGNGINSNHRNGLFETKTTTLVVRVQNKKHGGHIRRLVEEDNIISTK